MPLRFDSIVKNNGGDFLMQHLMNESKYAQEVYTDVPKNWVGMRVPVRACMTGRTLGNFVFTTFNNGSALEVHDIDFCLYNSNGCTFTIEHQLESDTGCIYEGVTDGGHHFTMELVDRVFVSRPQGRTYFGQMSLFPFQAEVYDSIDALNAAYGFGEPIRVGNMDLMVKGYSSRFVCPGSMVSNMTPYDYSFVIGEVQEKPEIVSIEGLGFEFAMVELHMAFGLVHAALGPEVFANLDFDKIKFGDVMALHAIVKVDILNEIKSSLNYTHK